MTLNTQAIENKGYQPQAVKTWKWEKRHHWLLVIALACVGLWLLIPQLQQASWVKSSLEYFPLVSGLVLVGEQLIKLI